MDFAALKARLAAISHRPDLSAQLPEFLDNAREKINRRFSLALVSFQADTDTNEVASLWPSLYIYAGLQALYEFINDGDNARYYSGLWETEADRQNITGASTATDPLWGSEPPFIKPQL